MSKRVHTALREENLSYSKLDAYRQCPMRFKLEYLEKRRPEPSSAMMKGTVVHEVIAERLRQIKASRRVQVITFESLQSLVRPVRERLANEGRPTSGFLNSELDRMFRIFVTRLPEVDGRKILNIESERITKIGPYRYKSILDLILFGPDNMVHIIDYKTGKSKYVKDERQLRSYALPLLKSRATESVVLEYWFLAEGITRSVQMYRDEREFVVDWIMEAADEIECAKSFPANLTWLCEYCGVRKHCPAFAANGGRAPSNR